jgi:hypothetical protein
MRESSSSGISVSIADDGGSLVYSGEAIYRPRKPHPTTGAPVPMIGVPDDAKPKRPDTTKTYVVSVDGEQLFTTGVYLERVSTCWWFILDREPYPPDR